MAISGRLRHVVTLVAPDGTEHTGIRAHVRGSTARESEIAGLDTGVISHTIMMRTSASSPRPQARWKVRHGTLTYNVGGSYDPTGKGRDLIVLAQEAC